MPEPFQRTPHLVDLVAQAQRLASLLPTTTDPAALDDAAVASVRLDGSPLDAVPDPDALDEPTRVDGFESWEREPEGEQSLWVDPMGFVHRSDRHVTALEYVGVRAALASDDLAGPLLTDPVPALCELHRRLTRGLVDPDRAGEPRRTVQVVHDASDGRILFYPADPTAIPGRLAGLGAWMVSEGAREHALITSGVLHHELLSLHPFEAANGRLARTAARLVLRSRGLDPGGHAQIEQVLAEDPLGYLQEVANTGRRRELTVWLERWAETVVEGLRRAARSTNRLEVDVPEAAAAWLHRSGAPLFTVADYRSDVGADPEASRHHLAALLDAGNVALVPGSRGLRFRRTFN